MGAIICKKHGRSQIQLVCADIRSEILVGAPLTDYREITDEEIPEVVYFLCSACTSKYSSLPFEETPLEPVCGACFDDMLSKISER